MIDLDKEDMDAVERSFADIDRAERRERAERRVRVLDVTEIVLTVAGEFAEDERAKRRERVLNVIEVVLTVAGALALLALCWLLIRIFEAEDAERRARDPQGAAARVERRLMAEDAAYRLCRRASGAVFALQKEAAE